jgi:hypothetical protein
LARQNDGAPFLSTSAKTKYHDAVTAHEPYDKIVKLLSDMRRETVRPIQHANAGNLRAYVLVNNRSEFNAPHTVQAFAIQASAFFFSRRR